MRCLCASCVREELGGRGEGAFVFGLKYPYMCGHLDVQIYTDITYGIILSANTAALCLGMGRHLRVIL